MDVTLQKHCAAYIYAVPDGLRELLSDISREVLRHQPVDLHMFIADYLDSLMITRENARVAAKLVQHIIDMCQTIVALLRDIGLTREEADRCATIIQTAFRKHLHKTQRTEEEIINEILVQLQIDLSVADQAARIIQNAFRKFQEHKQCEMRLLSGMIDWRVAANRAITMYRQTGVTMEEAHRAATLIKAAYKGYYTRRLLGKICEEFKLIDEESEVESISKSVRIDYSTVLPHVDFDTDMKEFESNEIIREILEEIINAVIPEEETTLEMFIKSLLNEIIEQIETPSDIIHDILDEIFDAAVPPIVEDAETIIKSILDEILWRIDNPEIFNREILDELLEKIDLELQE